MFASLLLAMLAPAAPVAKPVKPLGAAPKIVVVLSVPGQGPVVAVSVVRKVSQVYEATVEENGVPVLKRLTREVDVMEYRNIALVDSGATFQTGDGKPLTAAEAATRLKDGGYLIIPSDREPIDPAYRKAFSPEAVVAEPAKDSKTTIVDGGSPNVPVLVAVKADDKGVVRLPARGTRDVIVKVPVSKEVDGVTKIETIETTQKVQDLVPTPYDAVKPVVTTAEGKAVAADSAKARLAAGEIVLVSTNGKPVDGAFLKLVKPETLVMVSDAMMRPTSPLQSATGSGGNRR